MCNAILVPNKIDFEMTIESDQIILNKHKSKDQFSMTIFSNKFPCLLIDRKIAKQFHLTTFPSTSRFVRIN